MAAVPFVHSNFERVANDFYPTIDSRCVYGFLEHFTPDGLCVDVCAPDGSGIVDTLKACGYKADGLPDAFAENIIAQWITVNPPYKRGLVDEIINRQIQRLENKEVYGLAVLLRSNFDFAKGRKAMFDHPLYYGQIKLRFRPWWSEDRTAQPIHNYVWQLWKIGESRPAVLFANGTPPNKACSGLAGTAARESIVAQPANR
jgi:hypothetical protein